MGATGRVMIAAGVIILLFVAYQLWGTSLQTARAQDDLEAEFAEQLADNPTIETTTTVTPSTTVAGPSSTTLVPALAPPGVPLPAEGDPAGRIEIPRIGLDDVFVEGVSVADLKRGPGHYPGTPLPGQAGNAAIAGHRTTYGAPFHRVDELAAGDEIRVTTVQGSFVYAVRETIVVRPEQSEVLNPTPDNRLTLTSCHPKYSARRRIIVIADLRGSPVSLPAEPAEPAAPAEPALDAPDVSGEPASTWPAVLLGAACAAIWLVTWLVARRWPGAKWIAYGVGTPVFLVVLFFFFESYSRVLPANF
jgi:sortase A